jgi:hypothetical protein
MAQNQRGARKVSDDQDDMDALEGNAGEKGLSSSPASPRLHCTALDDTSTDMPVTTYPQVENKKVWLILCE